jgi:2-dehydropantoate 2-reductase
MRVVVLGAGSLGSLVGGRLATTEADVTLLSRESEHVEAVRESGLNLLCPDGGEVVVDVRVATDPVVAADADLLIVCVKSYDTDEAMADVAPSLDETDVLTLQNGLGNAETIAGHVPRERVIAGTTTHGAVPESPGVVRHAGRGDTTLGRYFAPNDDRVRDAARLLTEAGIETVVTDDPEAAVWTKVLVNAGINAATALARVQNGALLEHDSGEQLLERAVREGVEVARVEAVDVPEDCVERAREVANQTATNRSSMLQDIESGKRTEIEALNGALARHATDADVAAPVNETLADLVRLTERPADADD